jgi:hypothetical protein
MARERGVARVVLLMLAAVVGTIVVFFGVGYVLGRMLL